MTHNIYASYLFRFLSQLGLSLQKCHKLCGLNNRSLFSPSCRGHKSKFKVSAWSVSGEDSVPGLQSSHGVSCSRERKHERRVIVLSGVSLLRALMPSAGPSRLASSKPNAPKGPTSTYSHIGNQGFNIGIWIGTQFSAASLPCDSWFYFGFIIHTKYHF